MQFNSNPNQVSKGKVDTGRAKMKIMRMLNWFAPGSYPLPHVVVNSDRDVWPGPRTGSVTLFLDFDGVLHPGTSETFCYMNVLERIAQQFESIDFIITSTWRENADRNYLLDLFPVGIRHRVRGITPVLNGNQARHAEISSYVGQHQIQRWLAVDDEANLFPPSCPYLFLVNRIEALNPANEEALFRRLSMLVHES